ncbi:hypothetical protein ACFE04_022435 [Oxalis oulophora]
MDSEFPMYYFYCMLLLAVLVIIFILDNLINSQPLKLPPGPRKLPFIGNLHNLLGDVTQNSLLRLSKLYGPVMFLRLGSIPTLVISSADVAKEIFKKHDIVFSGRPQLYATKKLSYNRNNISFAPYGDSWRAVRKIATLELFTSKRVQSFQTVRDQEVDEILDFIARNSPQPVNLSRLTVLLANNVVCRATFGKKFDNEGYEGLSRFDALLQDTRVTMGKFNIADFYPRLGWINRLIGEESKLDKIFKVLDSLYEDIILEHLQPERQNKSEADDFIDVLLRIQKDPRTGTSARTIEWAMTELMRNPSAMRKAQDEIREVADGKPKVEENDLSKLLYLKAVIKETLRIRPPVPLLVPRETLEDCVVAGYNIPAKTRVFFDARLIGKDSSYWENPDEFIPERFLESSVDFKGQHFELIPFGAGRRGCPGINFGIQIVEYAVANLLYHFDWKLPEGMKSEDLAMEEAFGSAIKKKAPLCLIATPVYV